MPDTYTKSPCLVPFETKVSLADLPTLPEDRDSKSELKDELAEHIEQIAERQQVLHAADSHSLLLVFQGMDTSGKDSTIRHVLSGVNPAGCAVTSFKAPNATELDHDFLWRVSQVLPARGMIGVFNRSHYEDVLVVRVHPELLSQTKLRSRKLLEDTWTKRLRAIREWEHHLADNGTVILKFFLHLSKSEQRDRLLARLDDPSKHWKFDTGDVVERRHWDAYQEAYEAALSKTSHPWAPWYVIPADHKHYARTAVAQVVRDTLERLDLDWPEASEATLKGLDAARKALQADTD